MNDITYAVSVDVNNPIIPYNVYIASVLDSSVRYLEITLYENGNIITLSNTANATASLVTDNVLVNDSVNCTISDSIITVPLEDLQRHGNLDVQVTVTEGTKVLAIPFPIQVRVTPNIAEEAQIDENSLGSYAEVVHEIAEARGTYTTLHDAIAAKLSAAPGAVGTENLADESITVEKVADDLAKVINSKEVKSNKKTTLSGNESSNDFYPTTKAVADALLGINAGSVGFDETGTYTDGSIGAEISHQKNAIGQLGDIAAVKIAILQIAQKVVYIDEHGQDYYDDLYDALYPPAPLASISAVFVQGSTVVYKTNTLDSLKPMLTVTATYADQPTEVVTDYTLSGTLSVGTSTITVSWGSKTDTFNVIVTERESYIVDFENMQYIEDTCVLQNGTTTTQYPGWCSYPPIDIEGYNEIEYTDVPAYDSRGIKVNGISIYDSNNNYIGYVGVDNADESVIGQSGYDAKIGGYNISGTYQIPTNAKYAVFGATRGVDRLIERIPSATLK